VFHAFPPFKLCNAPYALDRLMIAAGRGGLHLRSHPPKTRGTEPAKVSVLSIDASAWTLLHNMRSIQLNILTAAMLSFVATHPFAPQKNTTVGIVDFYGLWQITEAQVRLLGLTSRTPRLLWRLRLAA
jgi:hypothetical protein